MDIYTARNKMMQERKTVFDLPINVTFYARVSTTREEQENSVENQITYFTEMIQNNPNWNYIEGYADRVRGEIAENRNEFMRMIEDGMNGKFDLILTKEVSRFARNTIDSLTYTRDLLNAGVGVFFQNDNICTIDNDSELRLTIMSSIAADEVRKLSERIRWGHKRSIENGHVLGNNRIFGYDKSKSALVINEKEAEMVRLIFELYATGEYSGRSLERVLYDRGYRNRNGNKLNHNTIFNIIQNPKYKGYYCANKTKVIDYRTKKTKELPEEEWVMYKDDTGEIVPAIVSEEIWERCNEIFKERSEVVKNKERSFKGNSVFTGKVYCSCHGTYWRTSYSNSILKGQPIYQWLCREKRRNSASDCGSFAIMERELYIIMSSIFIQIADNIEDYIDTFISVYNSVNEPADFEKRISELEIKKNNTQLKQDKLLELYMDNAITKTEFTRRNASLNETIEDIHGQIISLKKKINDNDDKFSSINQIKKHIKQMYDPNTEMTDNQVDELVSALIEKIVITPIDKNNMEINVILKTGQAITLEHKKRKRGQLYNCCSGIISKKICPERQFNFSRNCMRSMGHIVHTTYHVYVCIEL